jgi:hypothetical protein
MMGELLKRKRTCAVGQEHLLIRENIMLWNHRKEADEGKITDMARNF